MSNGINDLSPDIRDFLLNRNLIVSDSISDNGLSSVAVGLGSQANISSNENSIIASENLELSAIEYRKSVIGRNRYISTDDMVSATIIDNSFSYAQTNGGYIDENKELNIGGASTQAYDVIDGLATGGVLSNGDIRSSLAGRVLGATGGINDTPLGIIGGQQLLLAFGQKAAFNAQRELLGKVNLQPFSLLRGADFINPNYDITVSSTSGGRVFDTVLDLSGFNLPLSTIDEGGSIFESDSGFNQSSKLRNESLIKNTGKGQVMRLFDGINANQSKIVKTNNLGDVPTFRYKPDYETDNGSKVGIVDPDSYPDKGSDLTDITKYIRPLDTKLLGNVWEMDFVTTTNEDKSIIGKTKRLFEAQPAYTKAMFDAQGTPSLDISQINTLSGGRLSKGSGVLSEGFLKQGDKDNVFCRTWTESKSYSNVADLQKNKGLYNYKNKIRNDIEDSVLGDNGFVKISPYNVPQGESENAYDAKKFMFSIENLAWNDKRENLPKFEIGNGDPKTGTKGRVMWFPPYDIKFTDTTTVNWDSTNFVGRGEPIYTYNNTERSGNLDFKVIIDYPDYMNDSKITTDELMASLASGCLDYNKYFSTEESRILNEEINANVESDDEMPVSPINLPDNFNFYFPNDVASLGVVGYEQTGGALTNPTLSEGYTSAVGTPSFNTTNYGLNDDWDYAGFTDILKDEMSENTGIRVKLKGYASLAGNPDDNKALSDARITAIEGWFKTNINSDIKFLKAESNGDKDSKSDGTVDSIGVKSERIVTVEFEYQAKDDDQIYNIADVKKEKVNNTNELLEKIKRRFHREDEYFEKLKNSDVESDGIIYDTIREKIKFFHPAFHSTTPEGFNSRLTFLQQCTRQGPTDKGNKSNNLAFGSPPVCILRIGDFYNTKIIMNSLAITYDPLVWDLNPEGVGVQPMIANVSIGFKFIGGSSLNGPINKLQNAVSFNYFANSGVYDPRADRFVRKDEIDPKNGLLFDPKNGETNLREIVDDNQYPKEKPKTGIPNDAQVVAELESEKQTEVSATTISDEEIFENLGWTVIFNSFVNSGTTNTFDLSYNSGGSYPLTNLSKSYGYKIEIQTSTGLRMVMTGVFSSISPNNAVINSSVSSPKITWSQSEYGTGNKSFKFSLTSGGLTYNEIITVDVETGLDV